MSAMQDNPDATTGPCWVSVDDYTKAELLLIAGEIGSYVGEFRYYEPPPVVEPEIDHSQSWQQMNRGKMSKKQRRSKR